MQLPNVTNVKVVQGSTMEIWSFLYQSRELIGLNGIYDTQTLRVQIVHRSWTQ